MVLAVFLLVFDCLANVKGSRQTIRTFICVWYRSFGNVDTKAMLPGVALVAGNGEAVIMREAANASNL